MNGKQARNLRNIVDTETQDLPDLPAVAYQQTNKRTKNLVVGFTESGKEQLMPYETFTIEMGGCKRKMYQKAKALHYKFLQLG